MWVEPGERRGRGSVGWRGRGTVGRAGAGPAAPHRAGGGRGKWGAAAAAAW